MDAGRLVIMLRNEQAYSREVRVELLNMEHQKKKLLCALRNPLSHGHLLFVEEADPQLALKDFPSLNWHKAIMSE